MTRNTGVLLFVLVFLVVGVVRAQVSTSSINGTGGPTKQNRRGSPSAPKCALWVL